MKAIHWMMKKACKSIDTYCAKHGWMLSCVTLMDGSMSYIGDLRTAYFLCVEKGIVPELRTPTSQTCSVGYSKRDGLWYGWSHRAIYGFKTRKEAEEFAKSVS